MNKSTPITSRIQKRSIGGIVQPAIKGMGSVAKMDNKILKKNGKDTNRRGDGSLVVDRSKETTAPAKPSPNKMYNSPAKVDKNTMNSQGRSTRNQRNRDAIKSFFSGESIANTLFPGRKEHLAKMDSIRNGDLKDYTGEGVTVDKIKNKSETKQKFAGRTPYTVENGKGKIHGPKDSYKTAFDKRDMKVYGGMDLDQYTKEAKRQTKSFETTGKFDAPKKAKKKVAKVASLKSEGVKKMSIENIAAPGVKAKKLVAKAPKTAKQTRKSASIDKKLAKAKTARASGNIKKAERKERRVDNKQERIAKRSRTRSENTAIRGREAVDEGRDRKADRLLKRAANQENREIKKEKRKAARADRKAAKGEMTMTKSKVNKKPKSSKKKVLDSSRVPM